MISEQLNYADNDFPVRARKLIGNGQTFSFQIAGDAFGQLLPHLTDGRLAEPTKLGLKPKLQALLAILMLADAQGQAVSFEVETELIRVWVGVGRA